MWSNLGWLSLVTLFSHAQALYFYIDGPTQKCFFEELPKDTLVVGMEHDSRIHERMALTTSYRPFQGDTMERASTIIPAEP